MFFCPEGILHFVQLKIPFPYRLWIILLPVCAKDVTTATLKRPLITLIVSFDIDRKAFVLPSPYFCDNTFKE